MIRLLLIIGCILFVVSLGAILLFTLPAFTSNLDLSSSTTANIGTTISGITAPILNIISIYFLYVAFTKQQEANDIQRNRNDVDLAFRLLDDVNTELNNFTIKETNGRTQQQTVYSGTLALFRYCKPFYDNANRFKFFTEQYESDIIVSILTSYDLMAQKFELASLPMDIAKQFFYSKLKIPVSFLVKAQLLETHEMAVTIRTLYNKFSDEPINLETISLADRLNAEYQT